MRLNDECSHLYNSPKKVLGELPSWKVMNGWDSGSWMGLWLVHAFSLPRNCLPIFT